MAIDKRDKFTTMSVDEIEAKDGLSIPNYLKPIVSKAPKNKRDMNQYLNDLVRGGDISLDDIAFLLESGALVA